MLSLRKARPIPLLPLKYLLRPCASKPNYFGLNKDRVARARPGDIVLLVLL